jgi:hypothetical protein
MFGCSWGNIPERNRSADVGSIKSKLPSLAQSKIRYDCNETAAQKWIIGRGATTPVLLAGTGFCLDAGKSEAIAPYTTFSCLTFVISTSKWRWLKNLAMLCRPPCTDVDIHSSWKHCSKWNEYVRRVFIYLRYLMLTTSDQCVDLTDGLTDNGNRLQTYQCADGNVNQAWTT